MKIDRIWFSGIRTLSTPSEPEYGPLEVDEYLERLQKTEPLKPGLVNILIGENGSGKSALVDMIRSLRHLECLGSLPRENPPVSCCPAYAVEFEDGSCWSYLFPTTTMNDDMAISYIGCWQRVRKPGHYTTLGYGELYKPALTSPFPPLRTYDNIFYRNGRHVDDTFNEDFVRELNSIRHFLTGLAVVPKNDITAHYRRDGAFEFSDDNLVRVWFDDDHAMSNTLHGDWLPSGWKAFAWITAWLRNCPEGAVCLIEEPEIHLHPNLMRFLLETLIDVSDKRGQQLFISTQPTWSAAFASASAPKRWGTYGVFMNRDDTPPPRPHNNH